MKLVICGDLSVTEESKKPFENTDARAAFGDVCDLFASADRSVVNLECALTDSENRIKKCGPNLKGPKATADTMKAAGVTHCTLSNNHIFDFGKEGFWDTVDQLDRCGLVHTGWGKNYEDSRCNLTLEQDGVRITLVNVCEHEYSYATENRVGARPFDEFETMQDIREAKKDADYVIVVYHGGKELCRYPSPRLMKACREMVRCGADAVFCQHSHCIGSHENFEGGHILYGQGNFHFVKEHDFEGWNEGLVACLEFSKDGLKIAYEPVIGENNGIRMATDSEKKAILGAMDERSKSILDGTWKQHWHTFCESQMEKYLKAAGFLGRYTPEEYQRFAHYLDCEAHTDVWRELFPTWNATNEVD
ncbi:MAG: CapA family protein [Clostridia bacterium]|nr:CapA family protein [Clostridia bacterium]